tara:strand:- start:983 stop:1645 length:663 start_codon:yes stop_codon:yes gene_type:complete
MSALNERQLATKIHQTCKEKGLKQSVILNVLTKHKGYRSIQAADTPAVTDDGVDNKVDVSKEKLALMIHMRTDIYRHYPQYDLLPITLSEVLDKPEVDAGDSLFSFFFNKAYSDIFDVIPALERAQYLFENIEILVDATEGGVDSSAEDFIANSPLANSKDAELVDFIVRELHECSEGEDDKQGSQCQAMENAYHDIESLLDALRTPFYEMQINQLKEMM